MLGFYLIAISNSCLFTSRHWVKRTRRFKGTSSIFSEKFCIVSRKRKWIRECFALFIDKLRVETRVNSGFLHFFIDRCHVVFVIVSDGVTWCFRGFQRSFINTFVPTFELIRFVSCGIRIWQGVGTRIRKVFTINHGLFALREACWRWNFIAVIINKMFRYSPLS